MCESLEPTPKTPEMRNVQTTLKRPPTYHAKIVNGEPRRKKWRGGSERQRAIADLIDIWAKDDPDGIEGGNACAPSSRRPII